MYYVLKKKFYFLGTGLKTLDSINLKIGNQIDFIK